MMFRQFIVNLLLISSLLWAGNPAQADPAELQELVSNEDNIGWESVGLLDLGGGSFCTATLIEPAIILTAAHCLFDQRSGQRIDQSNIRFLAGWRNGRATAYSRVRHGAAHPDFQYSLQGTLGNVRNDLALIELNHPIRKPNVSPFDTATLPKVGRSVGVVSYAKDRAEAPSLQRECNVMARQNGYLIMSCLVDFGSSGAPVFSFDSGEAQIVAVVSSKTEVRGQAVSLGSQLAGPLEELRAHFDTSRPGAKFVTIGD